MSFQYDALNILCTLKYNTKGKYLLKKLKHKLHAKQTLKFLRNEILVHYYALVLYKIEIVRT